MNSEVNKKFPNSKFQGVAGMVFLRFFCPAFSAPDSYGLLDSSAHLIRIAHHQLTQLFRATASRQ